MIRAMLLLMIRELESQRLQVVKIPGREGGYVRAVLSENAPWYKELCAGHEKRRKRHPKWRTWVKRRNTLVALRRMLNGDRTSTYAKRLIPLVGERLRTTMRKPAVKQVEEPTAQGASWKKCV